MNKKLCNCSTSTSDKIDELESELRAANNLLGEKEEELEEEIMRNLVLEERITNLKDELEAKSEENQQLLNALIKLQEGFERFEEKFSTADQDMMEKDKIIAELTEKLQAVEKRTKISTFNDPRLTFDITEHSILPKTQNTLAWDDFCEQFSDESSIADEKTSKAEKSPEIFKFNGSTFEFQGGKSMESSTFSLLDASSSKLNELSLKFPTQSSTAVRPLRKSQNLMKKLAQKPLEDLQSLIVQCKFCNKILPSKKSLKCHIEIHEQKCKICQKSFAKKFSLKYHMKSHKIVE